MGNNFRTNLKLENLHIPSDVDYTYINNYIVPAYLLYKKQKLYPINAVDHGLFGIIFDYSNSKHMCSIMITNDMYYIDLLQLMDVYHTEYTNHIPFETRVFYITSDIYIVAMNLMGYNLETILSTFYSSISYHSNGILR